MDDLVAFLAARLDEDEATAKANIGSGPGWSDGLGDTEASGPSWPDYQTYDSAELDAANGYLDRFRPLRALREAEAKRAILDRHIPHETAFGGPACDWCSEDVDNRPQLAKERWPCPDVRSLAAVYSGHPDYRPEWKP